MATTIPPPPFLGPLQGDPVGGTYADWVNLYLLRWDESQQNWVTLGWGQHPWDSFPSGYYASERIDADGNADWGPNSTVIVVAGRSMPDFTPAPFVLEQPPAAELPDPRCPPNMWWTGIGDPFSVIGGVTLCSWLPPPPQQVCPPGTHWDPATETCVANFVPPPIIIPPTPPPPPPPETGHPNPLGDEITYELCLQMKANADAVIFAINQLQGALGGDPAGATACCANVVTAINLVSKSLLQIFALLNAQAAKPAPPMTFAPVITIDVPPQPPPNITVDAPATDVSGIVDQLAKIFKTLDVPLSTYQWMAEQGWITPELLQQLDTGDLGSGLVSILVQALMQLTKFYQAIGGFIYGIPTDKLGKVDEPLPQAIARLLGGALKTGSDPIYPVVKGMIDAVLTQLDPTQQPVLGNVFIDADLVLSKTLVPAITFNTIALGAAYFGWDTSEQLKTYVDLASEFIGLTEVKELLVGKKFKYGPEAVADMQSKAQFRQELPSAAAIAGWHARGLIDPTQLDRLYAFNGLPKDFSIAQTQSAYRPISPRALANLTRDTPFRRDDIRHAIIDSSIAPEHIPMLLELYEYNSVRTLYSALITEAEVAYRHGVVSEDELRQVVADAGWSDRAWQLIKSKVLLQRRVTLASEVEKQVVPLIANGNISADDGFQQLEAAGIQDWYANLVVTLATTKAEIHQAKLDAAAERKLELSRQRNLTKAAVAEFQRGVIDDTGLTAALATIGLDPTLVASVVAVQDATRTGRLRLIFGQLLLPEDAKVLSDRVAAIEGQFKKQMLTLDQARSQLQGLNVDGPELDALLARWAAALTATSKYAYLVDPLTGQKV